MRSPDVIHKDIFDVDVSSPEVVEALVFGAAEESSILAASIAAAVDTPSEFLSYIARIKNRWSNESPTSASNIWLETTLVAVLERRYSDAKAIAASRIAQRDVGQFIGDDGRSFYERVLAYCARHGAF